MTMITVANGLRLTQIRPYGRRVLHRGPKHFSSSSQKSPEGSILARAWNRYTAALIARPLTVKASVASVIFFASDSATQYITDSTANWNPARALSGSVFGVVSTTWLHFWWGFLEGFVGKRIPVTNYRLRNTLVKVFVDQSMGAPLYIYTYYLLTHFLQEWNLQPKKDVSTATNLIVSTHQRASEMLLPTMLRHWTLWPAVHTLNFYFNPLHHRVLVQNLVLVGWSGYLSHLNNGGLMTPNEEIEVTVEIQRRKTAHR